MVSHAKPAASVTPRRGCRCFLQSQHLDVHVVTNPLIPCRIAGWGCCSHSSLLLYSHSSPPLHSHSSFLLYSHSSLLLHSHSSLLLHSRAHSSLLLYSHPSHLTPPVLSLLLCSHSSCTLGAALFVAVLAPLTMRMVDKAGFNSLQPHGVRSTVEERMLVWLINHPVYGAGLPAGVKPVGGGRMEQNVVNATLDFKWTTPAAAGPPTTIPNEGAECKGSISSRSCTKGGSRTHPRSYANDQYQIIPTAQQIAWFGIPGNEHKPCFVLMHGRHFTFIMVTEGQYLVKSNHAPCFASAGTASSTSIQWKTKSFANNATYPPPGGPIAWAAAITLTRAEEMQYIMTHCQR